MLGDILLTKLCTLLLHEIYVVVSEDVRWWYGT